jgi:hypothetical protein
MHAYAFICWIEIDFFQPLRRQNIRLCTPSMNIAPDRAMRVHHRQCQKNRPQIIIIIMRLRQWLVVLEHRELVDRRLEYCCRMVVYLHRRLHRTVLVSAFRLFSQWDWARLMIQMLDIVQLLSIFLSAVRDYDDTFSKWYHASCLPRMYA